MGPRPRAGDAVRRIAVWMLLVACVLALGAISCSRQHRQQLFDQNLLPIIGPLSVQVDTSEAHPTTWGVEVTWSAGDADGSIDHIEYAIDPTAQESLWVSTTTNPVRLQFPVKHRDGNGFIVPEFHVLAIRVRDNRLEASPVVSLAVRAGDLPPSVRLTSPQPNPLLTALVPPGFSVSWVGDDPDGYPTHLPDHYRVRIVLESDLGFTTFWATPDSLLRQGERSGWEGWTLYGGDTTTVAFPDLPLGTHGLVAVAAFDDQGVNSPHLNRNENVAQFVVDGSLPGARFQSPLFDIHVNGSITPAPQSLPEVELPVNLPLELRWDASPVAGSRIVSTRWLLDPAAGLDSTTRTDPSDVHHWSPRITTLPASALIGPFTDGGSRHTFWLEIEDDQHRHAFTGLRLFVVTGDFGRELLVVNDTRFEVDKYLSGCPAVYALPWPSAAEFDTFLFARGGVPWRCVQSGVAANSVPGLLAGYSFDTLGTRRGFVDPSQAVSLAILSRYRHVLWLVDGSSAQNTGLDPLRAPLTALRAMSQPGHGNALAAYVSLGGQVWLAGGGVTYASLADYDQRGNNVGQTTVFKNEPVGNPELGPGHFLYDVEHLRSAINVVRAGGVRFTRSPAARGGWSGQGITGTLSAPDYSRLPAELRARDPATDPLPPTRLASQAGSYYPTTNYLEYVSAPNVIVEDTDPDPEVVHIESTLDTLFDASGIALLTSPAPVMTYYHGRDNMDCLFSGFDLWSWTRDDAQSLVDFVLGDIWHMTRVGPRAADIRSSTGVGSGRRPAIRGAVWHRLDPPRSRP